MSGSPRTVGGPVSPGSRLVAAMIGVGQVGPTVRTTMVVPSGMVLAMVVPPGMVLAMVVVVVGPIVPVEIMKRGMVGVTTFASK